MRLAFLAVWMVSAFALAKVDTTPATAFTADGSELIPTESHYVYSGEDARTIYDALTSLPPVQILSPVEAELKIIGSKDSFYCLREAAGHYRCKISRTLPQDLLASLWRLTDELNTDIAHVGPAATFATRSLGGFMISRRFQGSFYGMTPSEQYGYENQSEANHLATIFLSPEVSQHLYQSLKVEEEVLLEESGRPVKRQKVSGNTYCEQTNRYEKSGLIYYPVVTGYTCRVSSQVERYVY